MSNVATENLRSYKDGGHFRIEVPSIEGPKVFEALVKEAKNLGVTLNRISQGSGGMLLLKSEIREMVRLAYNKIHSIT